MRNIFICSIIGLLALTSCGGGGKVLPRISGKPGEIIVVATKAQWESETGVAIRDVLAADYPSLPQREPLFNLSNVPEPSLNKLLKVHRNMLYVKVSDGTEPSVRICNDIWAQPQIVVVVTVPPTDEAAAAFIRSNGDQIVEAFEKAERDRVLANAEEFEEVGLRAIVENKFGGSPRFPNGYSLKKQASDFIWISYETSYLNQGIFIYRFPFTDMSQFSLENLIAKRDEVLKDMVPAPNEGSYMITNPVNPVYRQVNFNGIDMYEVRTLWDTHNDYMGGPFVSRAFLSRDGNNIIVTEGFVYAPKYNKRNYLRQVDAITGSFRWAEGKE